MPHKKLVPKHYRRSRRFDSARHLVPWARGVAVTLCLLMPVWLPGTSSAGTGCVKGAVNCANNTMGTMRTCSATVQCTGATAWDFNTTTNLNVVSCLPAASYVMADPATFTLTAVANVTAPTNRVCGWSWQNPGRRGGGVIQITAADGLPVELMDFSVEDDEPAAEGEPGQDAAGDLD